MPFSILSTKLFIPPTRPDLVSRPRLIEQLNECAYPGCKLILISAPAGFGKTTLVSEWVRAIGKATPPTAIAWLSLDEGDNDLTRFLTYFIAALNQAEGVEAVIGKGSLHMLQSPQLPPTEAILTPLINEITTIPHRILLVLDDYHLINAQQIHDALSFLIENIPPQMHLVIATREDPRLPLSRLRARGQLTELRAADLRFTSSEAAEFLNQMMGLDLSAEDIAALETRTEGWIAGLQLAAISMQGSNDTTSLINSFTGSHRFVLDYLIEEVLKQRSERVQTFLLKTSILNRLTGPLCDALTGQDNGQSTLEHLEHANLFIVPQDNERHWYRYHHLFADLLRKRLNLTKPDQPPMLHKKASNWYEQNGFVDEAIEHALHAGEFERAAQMIQDSADDLWGKGGYGKLRRWLEMLPDEILFSKPYISIFYARFQSTSGQLEAAERILQAAEDALESDPNHVPEIESQKKILYSQSEAVKLRGRVAATRALICSYQGNVQGIIRYARLALRDLPLDNLTWRGHTALILGNVHGFRGDMRAAYEARFEALKACEAAGDIYFIMLAKLQLAITLREQGHLKRTIEICKQQFQFATDFGLSQTQLMGYLLAVWGETLAELNDLDGAKERADMGFKITERSGDLQMIGWGFMCLIRILLSGEELSAAEKLVRKMENIARESHLPPWIADQMSAWQARLWLTQGNLEAAIGWAEDHGVGTNGDFKTQEDIDFFLLFDYLVICRVLIAQGRLGESAKLLEHLLKVADEGGRKSKAIEILILQSLTKQVQGSTDEAITKLEHALILAKQEGFTRIFVDEGPPMAGLLYEALARGISPDYVQQLLAAFHIEEPEIDPSLQIQSTETELIEPLSERELEVLQLLAVGLTNQEIANRLYLSKHTVKVHARNIYSKLGVSNRAQAGAKARALGLVSPH